MQLAVIIPAAGLSTRFGREDKLAQDLGGRPLLLRTVELFTKRQEVTQVIVAGPPDDLVAFRHRFEGALAFHGVQVVEGGRRDRCETVRRAMAAVEEGVTHVAVHDAARPVVSDALLDRLLQTAQRLDAVIPVVPATDTVKRLAESCEVLAEEGEGAAIANAILGAQGCRDVEARPVVETLDRGGLVLVQTPQVFAVGLFRRACEADPVAGVSDDAGLVERLGEPVHAVAGDPANIKVTTKEDLRLVHALLNLEGTRRRPVHKRF